MRSKIADAIKLDHDPVVILLTDHKPHNALESTEEGGQKNRCIIPMFVAATHGRTVVLEKETLLCPGQAGGAQLRPLSTWLLDYFLSLEKRDNLKGNTGKKPLN